MKEMITVEKEVYDAVLRNSVRVSDLEAENQQLKELLRECKSSILFEADVVKETSGKHSKDYKMLSDLLTRIDAIVGAGGEK